MVGVKRGVVLLVGLLAASLMMTPGSAQVTSGNVVNEGPGSDAPYVFDPRFDADWDETTAAFAAALPFTDPLFPTSPRQRAERDDDTIHVDIKLAGDLEKTLSFPVLKSHSSARGVDPDNFPQSVHLEYARHHSGMSVVRGNPASVTVSGPPGTFTSLGTGETAVAAVASALGVPLENGPMHETHTESLPASQWDDWIGFGRILHGATLFETNKGEIVPYCDCKQVIISSPRFGETLNRVVGFLDEDDEVFLVHVTPWIDPGQLDLMPLDELAQNAVAHFNESTGHPSAAFESEFEGYDLYLIKGGSIGLAAFFTITVHPEPGTSTSWLSVAMHPEDGRLLKIGPRVGESTSSLPALLPLVAVVLTLGAIARIHRES